jgi:hypothetical protein
MIPDQPESGQSMSSTRPSGENICIEVLFDFFSEDIE